jgi:Flp pilus assembly protein TadG
MIPSARHPSSRRGQGGASMLETLIALPILCLLGLGAIQFGLLMQARQALSFALLEAARAGSADHADPATVRSGLARGLVPWLFGASDVSDYARNLARASVDLARSEATGRLMLSQVSPHPASFEDWGEPGRGASGELLASVTEIPNDNLSVRSTRMLPSSGVAGLRGAEPIGQRSGQTLTDANLLSLQLDYAVPLKVPVVGRVLAAAVRAWAGCQAIGPSIGFGPLNLPPMTPGTGQAGSAGPPSSSPWFGHACTMYGDPGPGAPPGHDSSPSLPVRVTVTVRMQSAARQSFTTSSPNGSLPQGAALAPSVARTAALPYGGDIETAGSPVSGESGLIGSGSGARLPPSQPGLAQPVTDTNARASPVGTFHVAAEPPAPSAPTPDPAVCEASSAS